MSGPEPERRYTRDELRRIIEEASTAGDGEELPEVTEETFSLAEIQAVAREVGIDAEAVLRAAARQPATPPLTPRVSFGTYQGERRLPRRLNEEEMRFVAHEADRFFGREGTVRSSPNYLEWYSKEAGAFVGMVSDGDGTRIRVIMDRTPQLYGGAVGVGLLGLLMAAGASGGVTAGAPLAFDPVVVILATLATLAGILGFWSWRRRSVQDQVASLLDQMEEGLPF